MLGPGIARALARDGITKDRIRQYLYENCTMAAAELERYAWHGGHTTYSLHSLAHEGAIPAAYVESADPQRRVRIFVKPEMIGIIVAGDPERNQSRGFVNNHMQGAPVSKAVSLPPHWKTLLAASSAIGANTQGHLN